MFGFAGLSGLRKAMADRAHGWRGESQWGLAH